MKLRHLLPACLAVLLVVAPRASGVSAPVPFSIHQDVIYKKDARGRVLRADIYVPRGGSVARLPAVLTVHSGSWARGSKKRMAPIARELAERGFVVMNINYSLAPAHKFPAPLQDCRAALEYMRKYAPRYRIDPKRIAVFGYSAGAHLALMVGLARVPGDRTSPGVQAVVAGAPPADLNRIPNLPVLRRFIGASRHKRPDLYRQASPITHVSADDPPIFLYHGRYDWIVPIAHSRRLLKRLRGAGITATLFELKTGHASTRSRRSKYMGPVIKFLRLTLKR